MYNYIINVLHKTIADTTNNGYIKLINEVE